MTLVGAKPIRAQLGRLTRGPAPARVARAQVQATLGQPVAVRALPGPTIVDKASALMMPAPAGVAACVMAAQKSVAQVMPHRTVAAHLVVRALPRPTIVGKARAVVTPAPAGAVSARVMIAKVIAMWVSACATPAQAVAVKAAQVAAVRESVRAALNPTVRALATVDGDPTPLAGSRHHAGRSPPAGRARVANIAAQRAMLRDKCEPPAVPNQHLMPKASACRKCCPVPAWHHAAKPRTGSERAASPSTGSRPFWVPESPRQTNSAWTAASSANAEQAVAQSPLWFTVRQAKASSTPLTHRQKARPPPQPPR